MQNWRVQFGRKGLPRGTKFLKNVRLHYCSETTCGNGKFILQLPDQLPLQAGNRVDIPVSSGATGIYVVSLTFTTSGGQELHVKPTVPTFYRFQDRPVQINLETLSISAAAQEPAPSLLIAMLYLTFYIVVAVILASGLGDRNWWKWFGWPWYTIKFVLGMPV